MHSIRLQAARTLAAIASLVLALAIPGEARATQVNLTDLQGQVKRAEANITALGDDLLATASTYPTAHWNSSTPTSACRATTRCASPSAAATPQAGTR